MKLFKNVAKAIKSINGSFEITLLEDQKELEKYRITNIPGLVINEKLVSQGKVLTNREIVNYIKILS